MGWLTEKVNPTSKALVGPDAQLRVWVIIKFPISIGVIVGLYYLLYRWEIFEQGIGPMLIAIIFPPAYCIGGYLFRPNLDEMEDENPFRVQGVTSQDAMWWMVFLWPGRFVAQTFVDIFTLVRYAGTKPKP